MVWRRAIVALALAGTGNLTAAGRQGTAPDPSTDAVVAAAVAYVAAYTADFAFLLADETARQRVVIDGVAEVEERETVGELFLTWLPVDQRWIAVHDVAMVDGRPVADRTDIRTLLEAGSVRSVAAAVIARNARYNLGRVVRNFNEPTLALQVLNGDGVERFQFSRARLTIAADGATVVTVGFRERSPSTLIASMRGTPIFTTGTFDIEFPSGRIRRTTLHLEDGPVTADLETTYRLDAGVGLWVPAVFTEVYRRRDDGQGETIRCEARYENYRRFAVSGRLVP